MSELHGDFPDGCRTTGNFERAWAQIAKGFEDLSEDEVEKLAVQALEEARDEMAQQAVVARPADASTSIKT